MGIGFMPTDEEFDEWEVPRHARREMSLLGVDAEGCAAIDGHERAKFILEACQNHGRLTKENAELKEANELLRRDLDQQNEYKRLFSELDSRFGCKHTDHGPEDMQNIIRHVDELFHDRDLAVARNKDVHSVRVANTNKVMAENERLQEELNNAKAIAESHCNTAREQYARITYLERISSEHNTAKELLGLAYSEMLNLRKKLVNSEQEGWEGTRRRVILEKRITNFMGTEGA